MSTLIAAGQRTVSVLEARAERRNQGPKTYHVRHRSCPARVARAVALALRAGHTPVTYSVHRDDHLRFCQALIQVTKRGEGENFGQTRGRWYPRQQIYVFEVLRHQLGPEFRVDGR